MSCNLHKSRCNIYLTANWPLIKVLGEPRLLLAFDFFFSPQILIRLTIFRRVKSGFLFSCSSAKPVRQLASQPVRLLQDSLKWQHKSLEGDETREIESKTSETERCPLLLLQRCCHSKWTCLGLEKCRPLFRGGGGLANCGNPTTLSSSSVAVQAIVLLSNNHIQSAVLLNSTYKRPQHRNDNSTSPLSSLSPPRSHAAREVRRPSS